VPAGKLRVSVVSSEGMMFMGGGTNLWSGEVNLTEAEVRELTIEVATSTIAGVCYMPDGSPAVGVWVQASGKAKDGEGGRDLWLGSPTDSKGTFRFAQVAEGTWSIEVSSRGGEAGGRGKVEGIEVAAGLPVDLRIDLEATILVQGRVDLAILNGTPRWGWLAFYVVKDTDPPDAEGEWVDGSSIDKQTGRFSTDELTPGRYRVRLHASIGDDNQRVDYVCDDIIVPPTGLKDVVLRPLHEKESSRRAK
jgi:hypothetical protein